VKREAHDGSKVPGSLSDALTLVLRAELELARHDRDGAHTATSRREIAADHLCISLDTDSSQCQSL
jgi:hypothetical protein